MAYSTIINKTCKCGCGKRKTLGYDGYNYACAPEEIKATVKEKTRKQIKQARQRLQNKVLKLKPVFDEEKIKLQLWYLARKHEMCGSCEECGAPTCKGDDKYYRWSVCHIIPKALVPEVATHHMNWIELCQIHHQEYDAGFERAKRMGVFRLIQLKFQKFKHLIPEDKVKWVNPYLYPCIPEVSKSENGKDKENNNDD